MRLISAMIGAVLAATWMLNPPLAVADSPTQISGNWKSYLQNPYEVYLDMWGLNIPNRESLKSNVDMLVWPSEFPNNTKIRWDVTPDPDGLGVNGYLQLAYGNYDDNAFAIPGGPKQIKNITAMAIDADWVYAGDPAGMLSETWLTSTSHALGGNSAGSLAEVGFASKVPASDLDWVNGLPTVGTFSDSKGVTWTVKVKESNQQGSPYYYAYRDGLVDHHGTLDFKSYFTFLVGAGKLTGNEYFNGVAYGVEPSSGAASLTITRFTPTYA
ncbi:hypothetical protein [Mycolicibacterium sp.]|uniref:hypothetical protein n=1 Tax=Mycolicibacterium sp. TaxID=2320850 RepID=UPI001A27779E|nr:hypothetical protein [Mycolicibacterium sp.]MBJ7336724.1 hypothetical protein [Mycolicibacterium sp.]